MEKVQRQLLLLEEEPQASGAAITVAFASSDWVHVDQHFGTAFGYAVFSVTSDGYRLLRVAEFERQISEFPEGKLRERLEWVADCDVMYCRAVGSSAMHQLLARGIQPIRIHESACIEDLLGALQTELKDEPSNWLERFVRRKATTKRREQLRVGEDKRE